MQTTEEVYFLVRTGTWSPEELENWVQQRHDEFLYGNNGVWEDEEIE